MSADHEIDFLPPKLKDLVKREVERQLKKNLQEEEPPQLADLPQVQQIGVAPRNVSLFSRLYLRLYGGTVPSFGWVFAVFGFTFAFIAAGLMGLDDTIPRQWVDAGKGKITSVDETNSSYNDRKIYAYLFSMTDQQISGTSYGFNGKYEIGDEVTIEKSGHRYRIEGLTLTGVPWFFPLLFLGMGSLFGVIGLGAMMSAWFTGGNTIICLQDGIAITAKFIGMNPTSISVGGGKRTQGKPVMKVDFEYQVDGETYTASAWALDTARLTDKKYKVVLYDPMVPKCSVVLDGLPSGIHLDESTEQFWTNPLHCVLPLLVTAVVVAEVVAIIVLTIRAI